MSDDIDSPATGDDGLADPGPATGAEPAGAESGVAEPGVADPTTIARLLRQRAATGPELWLAVEGRSMWPTIRPPARVQLAAAPRPRVGEVWAFVDPGGAIVVHRCDRRTGAGYVFRGDGLRRADPWVPAERVVGRVVAVVDGRGIRAMGDADRVTGLGRLLLARLRSVARRTRNWVRELMTARERHR